MLAATIVFALTCLQIAAFYFAFQAIRTSRTPQGATGWALFLIAAPYLGVPAYLFLGHSKFKGFVAARRESQRVIAGLDALKSAYGRDADESAGPEKQSAATLEHLAEMPIVRGNRYEVLIDGNATFTAIFDAILAAERYVLVAFYILRDDALGRELRDRLIERAKAGVTVKVLYDAIGSTGLPGAFVENLRAAGVDICDFHSLRRPANRFQLNFRNHRKIVICDGVIGFVGGHNVGDEYMGRDPKFGRWRDTHLRLEGPMVPQLQLVFAEDWHWAREEVLDLNWSQGAVTGGEDGLVMATGPGDPMETGSLYFAALIGTARERLWIASPYFVPDLDLCTALKLAALRGVDVRILIPNKADHLLVWLAAFAYFDELTQIGVRFYRYRDGFMHQKVVVIDDTVAGIGTHNLDVRSCRLNFEVTALLFGSGPASEVARMLEVDFASSEVDEIRLADRSALRRIGAPVARLFAPLL